MRERKPLVHRAMFNPGPEGQLRFTDLMQKLGGEAHREVVAGIDYGVFTRYSVPEELRDRFNAHFNNALADHLGLPGDINLKRFWKAREKDGVDIHPYMRSRFPSLKLDILSGVTDPEGDASDTVATLAQEGHSSQAGHERKRRMLFGLVSATIEADDMAIDLEREKGKVNNALNQYFFANGEKSRPYRAHSYHDKSTNAVVQLTPDPESGILIVPDNVVAKSFSYSVRDVKGDGAVYYDSNIKPRESAIAKSIDRAVKNGGYVKPEKDVQDRFRLVVARMEPRTSAEEMDQVLRSVLNDHYRPITGVEIAHGTDGYKNGNHLGWHRVKYSFDGVPTPLEAVVYDLSGFLNYQYEVGNRNPKTGIYGGNARDLYEVFRLGGLLEASYPREGSLYKVDPQKAIADRMEELVPGIRKEGLSKSARKNIRVA